MSPKQIAYQAIKYLLAEGEEAFLSFSSSDVEGLVKHTLHKLGHPPSLVTDEVIEEIIQLVEKGIDDLRKSQQPEQVPAQHKIREAPTFSHTPIGASHMITKEAWYIEAEEKERAKAICPTDLKEREEMSKERSHLPGDGRLKPEPFRKEPKKLV